MAQSKQKIDNKYLVTALFASILVYFVLIALSYATGGVLLLPLEEWIGPEQNIPFVDTLHFILIGVAVFLWLLSRQPQKGRK